MSGGSRRGERSAGSPFAFLVARLFGLVFGVLAERTPRPAPTVAVGENAICQNTAGPHDDEHRLTLRRCLR